MNRVFPSTQGKSDGDALCIDSTAPDEVSWQAVAGGAGAPSTAEYVVVSLSGSLSAERRLQAGTGLGLTDGGANADLTVAVTDAELLALAGLTSAADKLPYFTGSGTASLADLTSFARTLLDDANASAARTTLGVAIGSDVQAWDSQLDTLSANGTAVSVWGRSANSAGDRADIAAGANSTALSRTGDALSFVSWASLVLAGLLTAWVDPGYGDGKAGSVTYAANTTISEEIRATDINIDTGVTVTVSYPIRCTGTLSFDSSTAIISANGTNASGATAGSGNAVGYGSGFSGVDGVAGRSTVGNGTIGNSRTLSGAAMLGAANAGNGGAGGTSGANAGGGAGTATQPNATANGRGYSRAVIEYGFTGTGQVLFGGASGGSGGCTPGGGTATSGGSGGSAGVAIVWSRIVDASAGGGIQAKGGNGGNAAQTGAGAAGGGAGSGGGLVIHVYSSHNTLPTLSAAKGTGGTLAGAGAANGADGQDGKTVSVVMP